MNLLVIWLWVADEHICALIISMINTLGLVSLLVVNHSKGLNRNHTPKGIYYRKWVPCNRWENSFHSLKVLSPLQGSVASLLSQHLNNLPKQTQISFWLTRVILLGIILQWWPRLLERNHPPPQDIKGIFTNIPKKYACIMCISRNI